MKSLSAKRKAMFDEVIALFGLEDDRTITFAKLLEYSDISDSFLARFVDSYKTLADFEMLGL
jgi:hypothetical protein